MYKYKLTARVVALLAVIAAAMFLLPFFQMLLTQETTGIRSWQYAAAAVSLALLVRTRRSFSFAAPIPRSAMQAVALASLLHFLGCAFFAFRALAINGIDFSIFDWMLASTNKGQFMYSPIYHINHFGVHPSWILLPLVPLHALFDSPYFLLGVGSSALWLASVPLWYLAKLNRLTDIDAGLVVLAYLTTPFVGTVVSDGFRIEALLPLFTFSFIYFWQSLRPWLYCAMALLLLSVKEDAALYLIGFSFYALWDRSRWRQAALLMVASFAVLAFNLLWAQPYFLAGIQTEPGYLKFWGHFGSSKSEIVQNMVQSPLAVGQMILTSGWWKVYAPLLLLPLLSKSALFASLPGIILLGTAASYPGMYGYGHYYPLLIVCFALYGMVDTYHLGTSRQRALWRIALVAFPLFHAGYLKLRYPNDAARLSLAVARQHLEEHFPERPICAQTIAFPHLGYRLNLEPLDNDCLAKPGAMVLVAPLQSPYPYAASQLEDLATRGQAQGRDLFTAEVVHVFAAEALRL